MIVFIHVVIDNKYLPWGPWKKILSASLYEVIVSTANSMIYPCKILSTQKSIALEMGLLTLVNLWINSALHSTASLLWKFVCRVANIDNQSCSTIGNYANNILWISMYKYRSNQFSGLNRDLALSSYTNGNVLDSIQSSISFFVGCHNISLNSND